MLIEGCTFRDCYSIFGGGINDCKSGDLNFLFLEQSLMSLVFVPAQVEALFIPCVIRYSRTILLSMAAEFILLAIRDLSSRTAHFSTTLPTMLVVVLELRLRVFR